MPLRELHSRVVENSSEISNGDVGSYSSWPTLGRYRSNRNRAPQQMLRPKPQCQGLASILELASWVLQRSPRLAAICPSSHLSHWAKLLVRRRHNGLSGASPCNGGQPSRLVRKHPSTTCALNQYWDHLEKVWPRSKAFPKSFLGWMAAPDASGRWATTFFFPSLSVTFPPLITYFITIYGYQLLKVHDITSRSTYLFLFCTFSYEKIEKREETVVVHFPDAPGPKFPINLVHVQVDSLLLIGPITESGCLGPFGRRLDHKWRHPPPPLKIPCIAFNHTAVDPTRFLSALLWLKRISNRSSTVEQRPQQSFVGFIASPPAGKKY